MENPSTTPGVAVACASVIDAATAHTVTGTTLGSGQRERRLAPATGYAHGFAPSGPAATADRLLGNLRLSG